MKTTVLPKDYNTSYAWCRTFGHSWEEWHSDHTPAWGYHEAVYCVTCGTERLFTIDSRGQVSSRRYIYPEGYDAAKGVARAEFRLFLRRHRFFVETRYSDGS